MKCPRAAPAAAFAAAALCLAATSAPALAASAVEDDADRAGTIIVVGQTDTDRAARQAAATPGGTDVVTHHDYADRTAVSLRDVLAFSPGVYAQPRFGQEVRISIRGSGLSRGFHMRGLTLLQDGIPINLADDNGDFQELEPIFFDHLQVYRGANALRLGSGTLGGAINGVTPTGVSAPGLYARIDGGSWGLARGLVSAGFGEADANAWAALSADRHNGDRDHAERRSLRFHGNAGFRLAEAVFTRFYASINVINQELPGALSQDTALTAPRTGNFTGDQARDIRSIRLQNRTTVSLGDATVNFGAFLNAKQLYHPIFQVLDQQSTDRGLYARAEWQSGPFAATLGAEARWGTTLSRRYLNVGGKRGALTFEADQQARTANLYGELRVEALPRLTLIAGAIHAHGVRRQQQVFPQAVTARASFSEFSPRFGVLWQPAEGATVYANYSRSAELPTFVELAQVAAFVPVRAQSAWTAEVGTRGRIGGFGWDLSLYRADLVGEMLQFSVNAAIPAATFNAGRTRHQGVELALSYEPAPWLRLRQIWQYSDFTFRRDAAYGDNRLPVIPRHVLRSEVRLGNDALHVAPHLEWVPQGPFADYRNTHRVPGYALLGLTAGATLRPGIDLFADARNLTGKRAVGDISAAISANKDSVIFYPVEGRAFYAGLRARF